MIFLKVSKFCSASSSRLLCGAKTAWSEQQNQTGYNATKLHSLYEQGLALYKSDTKPTDIKSFKEAIRHNFQGTVDAIKLADKKLAIYPHEKDILGIRALLIKALELVEKK